MRLAKLMITVFVFVFLFTGLAQAAQWYEGTVTEVRTMYLGGQQLHILQYKRNSDDLEWSAPISASADVSKIMAIALTAVSLGSTYTCKALWNGPAGTWDGLTIIGQ